MLLDTFTHLPIWHIESIQIKKKKKVPKAAMNNSLQPLKIYAYIFYHSFNQPQIPTLVPLCVLCFIKQVEANRPRATNNCGQYPGSTFRKEFRSANSYSYVLWLVKFICTSAQPNSKCCFHFLGFTQQWKNPNPQITPPFLAPTPQNSP